MPGYKGHLYGGVIAYTCVISLVVSLGCATHFTGIEWLFWSLVGSLFPDIDIKSKGQKFFYAALCFLLAFLFNRGKIKLFAIVTAFAMVPLLVNHRGLFHRIWFVMLFPATLAWLIASYFPFYHNEIMLNALFFIAGAVSHLWLDFGLSRMIRQW